MLVQRVVSSAEYAESLAIRRTVFIEELSVPENLEADSWDGSMEVFLLRPDASRAAVATGRYRAKGALGKFERIATLKAWRGRGLGRLLMEAMESDIRTRYPDLLPFMHAQEDAVPFYQKIGWSAVGERFTEAGIAHRIMIRHPSTAQRLRALAEPSLPPAVRTALEADNNL